MGKKYKIEKNNKKNRWNLRTNDKPQSPNFLSASRIEMIGNNILTLEGCHGVVEYTDTYIKLKLSKGYLILCGNEFHITLFENKLISVKGSFSCVEFCV